LKKSTTGSIQKASTKRVKVIENANGAAVDATETENNAVADSRPSFIASAAVSSTCSMPRAGVGPGQTGRPVTGRPASSPVGLQQVTLIAQ